MYIFALRDYSKRLALYNNISYNFYIICKQLTQFESSNAFDPGITYYYVLNQQGDVIRIVDENGTTKAEYTYDAWGNVIASTGTDSGIGEVNPLLYRGYYYDSELGMYYLRSRYYDPRACLKNHSCNLHTSIYGIFCFHSVAVARYAALIQAKSPANCDAHLAESIFQTRSRIRRFINADSVDYLGENETELSYNLFAYCENDAVNCSDEVGKVAVFLTPLLCAALGLTFLYYVNINNHQYIKFKFSKGGKQHIRDSGLIDLSNAEIDKLLKSPLTPKKDKQRLKKEQKARKQRNKQKRKK